jgi:hypothetical protein
MHHCVQQGVWTGVTSLVAMASNAPPDVGPWPLSVQAEVDPMAAVGSGRQGLQVLVFWVLARRSRVVHAGTGGFSRLIASSGSVAAIVDTRTSHPHFRRFWPRPTIMRHDPGLAASPPVRYMCGKE